MKLLFLDMDGVVNKGFDNAKLDRYKYCDCWSNPADQFDLYYVDPILAGRVMKLVFDFDLHIVSTSTWRCRKNINDFRALLSNRFLPGERLVGFTPDGESEGMTRADEIRYYLSNCSFAVERYIILDDEAKANYSTKLGRFFQSSFYKGYTEAIDRKVRKYLETEK